MECSMGNDEDDALLHHKYLWVIISVIVGVVN